MTPGPLGSLIDYVKNQTNALGELMQGSKTYDKYIPGIEKINQTANALPEDQRKEFTKSVGIPDSLLRKYSSLKQKEEQQQYMGNPNANRQSLVSSVKDKYIQSPQGQMFPSALWNQPPEKQKRMLSVNQMDQNGNVVKDRFGNPQVNWDNPFIQAGMATVGDLQAVPGAMITQMLQKDPSTFMNSDEFKNLPVPQKDAYLEALNKQARLAPGQRVSGNAQFEFEQASQAKNWTAAQQAVDKIEDPSLKQYLQKIVDRNQVKPDKVWEDLSKRYSEVDPKVPETNAWLSPDGKLIDTKEHIRIESVPSAEKAAGTGGYEDAMKSFMDQTGGVRVTKNGSELNVQWQSRPTQNQIDALRKTLNVRGGRVFFDTPAGKTGFFDYMNPTDAITSLKKLFQADNGLTERILREEPPASLIPQLSTIYNSQKGTLSPELDAAYQSLLQKYADAQLTPEQLATSHVQ